MDKYSEIKNIVENSNRILVVQADNPDADSLASSLALESILGNLGKEPIMYCGIDMPQYLKYLSGWERVINDIPSNIDSTIIVDTSSKTLLDYLEKSDARSWVASKPVIVLDHHANVNCDIDYANVVINDSNKVSTGELIYDLSKQLSWEMPLDSLEFIMTSILADSLGLTSDNTTYNTYIVMSELVRLGVDRPKLEEKRREYTKMAQSIFRYKGKLIERTEIIDDKLALVIIPQEEINQYSPLYNPAPLIQGDLLQIEEVTISIVLKHYDSKRTTAAIRCNQSAPIAAKLAESFGGGGHKFAAGFKVENSDIQEIKEQVIEKFRELSE